MQMWKREYKQKNDISGEKVHKFWNTQPIKQSEVDGDELTKEIGPIDKINTEPKLWK